MNILIESCYTHGDQAPSINMGGGGWSHERIYAIVKLRLGQGLGARQIHRSIRIDMVDKNDVPPGIMQVHECERMKKDA